MSAETTGTPRVVLVFESMFGNTATIAESVASGLREAGATVDVYDVRSAPPRVPAGTDLLVVGAPTHAFGLSRERTRADAVRQGAPADRAGTGIREWLGAVALPDPPPDLAAFDTRAAKVRWLPKAAGPAALRLGRGRGLAGDHDAIGFLVHDVPGPLLDHEVERAAAWGRALVGPRPAREAGRG